MGTGGVSRDMTTDGGGPKCREFSSLMFDDSDFDLPLSNALCLHDWLQLDEVEAMREAVSHRSASDTDQAVVNASLVITAMRDCSVSFEPIDLGCDRLYKGADCQ